MERRTPPSCAPRAAAVRMPIIPTVAGWIAETPGTISLGQGVVAYGPPPEATAAIPEFLAAVPHHRYIPDAGLPELRAAFAEKLRGENGIDARGERRIIVTAGANQGFITAILGVCDPGDEVILPAPFYFNHEMAVALAGARAVAVPTDAEHQPDPDAIARAVTPRTRAVVTVSPNNPTGAVYDPGRLRAINALCDRRGIFHVSDEAYECFVYDGARHLSPGSLGADDVTLSLFSFSKSYGMASWRVGVLVAPERLFDDLMKIQDTVAICGPAVSQFVALRALRVGRGWCDRHVEGLAAVRDLVLKGLSEIPDLVSAPRPRGAFYLFARVRTAVPALLLAERLVREHRVAVIPGETFGAQGGCFVRIGYGALDAASAQEGIARLVGGLKALARP